MHEFTFADAQCQDQHTVLGIPLRNFCLGHRLLLLKQRNPVYCLELDGVSRLHAAMKVYWLIEAVYICAQSFALRERLEKGQASLWERIRNKIMVKLWHYKRGKNTDWDLEIAKFRDYTNQSNHVTDWGERHKCEGRPFIPIQQGKDVGRAFGGPYDASLIQFLCTQFGYSETQALEYPLALAQLHYLSNTERNGGIMIMNGEEIDFKLWVADKDLELAKAAGFNSVEEHVASVVKQIEADKAKAKAKNKR